MPALMEAAEKDDVTAFRIFGPAGKAVLTSGDPKQDKSFEIRAARPQEPRNEGRDVMAATLQALEVQLEDPLAHLPCSMILEYGKGQIIYSPEDVWSKNPSNVQHRVRSRNYWAGTL